MNEACSSVHTGTCGSNNIIASTIVSSAYQTCASITNTVNLSVTQTPTATYSWNFGDGTSLTGSSVSHVYNTAVGSPFTVTLTVTRGAQTVVSSTQIYVSQCTAINNSEANWYVAPSGGLKFNTGVPVFDSNFSETNYATYALATQNDVSGNVLFYTNKSKVWNNLHQPITTTDIDTDGGKKDSSILILLKPGSTTQYYIFTNTATSGTNSAGFRYHIVNVSGSAASIGTTKVAITTPTTEGFLTAADTALKGGEGITAIKKCSSSDYWIITTLQSGTATFLVVYSFTNVSTNGGLTYVSKFQVPSNIAYDYTSLEAAPNGDKLYQYINVGGGKSYLYDFDKVSGVISSPLEILVPQSHTTATFSPNSKLLYVANGQHAIYQYNLSAVDINATKIQVASNNPYGFNYFNGMQIGPDNKIYVAGGGASFSKKYGVIHNPNILATASNQNACNFSYNGPVKNFGSPTISPAISNIIDAKAASAYTSPASISAYVTACKTYKFFADYCIAGHNWDFGDPASGPANNIVVGTTPSHFFSGPGTYTVKLKNFGNLVIASKTITIPNTTPVIIGSTTACTSIPTSNITNNSTTLLPGETALWTITSGVGIISGANNQSSVTINWTNLTTPGTITLAVTNTAGCVATTTQTITSFCPCSCLENLSISYMPALDDTVILKTYNDSTNQICQNINVRTTWNFGNGPITYTGLSTGTHLPIPNNLNFTVLFELLDENNATICSKSYTYGATNGKSANQNDVKIFGKLNSIEVLGENHIQVHPNPSSGIFNIHISEFSGKVNIQVTDINGKKVYEVKNEDFNTEKTIDLSKFRSGTYILKIEDENLNFTQKLIKN